MKPEAVTSSYRRWAPVYDHTFGAFTRIGRRRVVDHINSRGGSVLEVGVGTGLSLPNYGDTVQVTGIDFSAEMLAKAQEKVDRLGLTAVVALRQMDARHLDFPDASFDVVVAMRERTQFPRSLLARLPDLKMVAVAATGTDNVDPREGWCSIGIWYTIRP